MAILDIKDVAKLSPSTFKPNRRFDIDDVLQKMFLEIYEPISKRIPDDYFLDRLASAIFYRVPMLLELDRDLAGMNVLELGCGRGLKSIPWSSLFRRYWGVDLDPDVIAFAKGCAAATARDNVSFVAANVADIVKDPKRFGIDEPIDFIVMYAVLEHLTLEERESVMRIASEILAPGGMLLIAETPNRLIPHDGHSSFLHFFQQLPADLALNYIDRSSRPGAADMLKEADQNEALHRFGTSVSFHEFELFLTGARGNMPPIISNGWQFWPAFDEPIRRDELALADYFRAHALHAHPTFARYWIEAIFDFAESSQKPYSPGVRLPAPATSLNVERRPQCWTVDLYSGETGCDLTFDLNNLRDPFLQFDINVSEGAFGVFDSNNNQLGEYEIARLREARIGRWHARAAIDLSRFNTADGQLTLRPRGDGARLAVEGVFGDEAA